MRLSERGRIVAAFGLTSWAGAMVTGSLIATMFAFAATLTLALSIASLRAPRIDVQRALPRDRYIEGDSIEVDVTITLRHPRTARVIIEDKADPLLEPNTTSQDTKLARGRPHGFTSAWIARSWGPADIGPLRLIVGDAMGIVEHAFTAGPSARVLIRPFAEPLRKYKAPASNPERALGLHSVSRPGDGGNFFALRNYQPGDSIRRINWKATARSGQTMVNQVDRETYARIVMIVDLREKETFGADSARARNGRAAATLLQHHDRARDQLRLLALHEHVEALGGSTNARYAQLIDDLSSTRPGGAVSMLNAVRANLTAFRPRSPAYFLTSGTLDDELGRAVGVVAALGGRPIVIATTPDVATTSRHHDLIMDSRKRALSAVQASGGRVIDWPSRQSLEVVLSAT